MVCKFCGSEVADNAKFCTSCGNPVQANANANNSAAQQNQAFETYTEPYRQTYNQQSVGSAYNSQPAEPDVAAQEPKKSRKKLVISIIAVLVALAVAITGVLVYFKKKDNGTADTAKKAYSAVLKDEKNEFGETKADGVEVVGVCYAELIDFDGDGEEEFLTTHNNGDGYEFAVYSYDKKKGSATQVGTGKPAKNESKTTVKIVKNGDKEYIKNSENKFVTVENSKLITEEEQSESEYENVSETEITAENVNELIENIENTENELENEENEEETENAALTATEDDYKKFEEFLQTASWVGLSYANCSEFIQNNLSDIIHCYIADEYAVGIYSYYFDFPSRTDDESAAFSKYLKSNSVEEQDYIQDYLLIDPEQKFVEINEGYLVSAAAKLDADKIDWIIENVFGLNPDRSLSTENFYYSGDYLYFKCNTGGRDGNDCAIIAPYELGNEEYGFIAAEGFFNCNENGAYDRIDTSINICYYKCKLKEDKNVGRYWAIEAASEGSNLCFDLPDGETDPTAMYNAYKEVIDSLPTDDSSDFPSYWNYYALYDMDGDGVDELITHSGTCEADYTYYFYTFKNGKAENIGEYTAFHSELSTKSGDKSLYSTGGHMDYAYIYKFSIKNGKLDTQEVFNDFDEDYSSLDGYDSIQISDDDEYEGDLLANETIKLYFS